MDQATLDAVARHLQATPVEASHLAWILGQVAGNNEIVRTAAAERLSLDADAATFLATLAAEAGS